MKKNIAIIGGGISGMAAAWLLHEKNNITLYEKEGYIGGHANTQIVDCGDERIAVDTGFMVFNKRTYPLFMKIIEHFNIPIIKTNMSFGIRIDHENFEFSSDNVFVQKGNIFRPSYWKMLTEIVSFNKNAQKVLRNNSDIKTLGDLINALNLSHDFRDRYILPMAGAIWSIEKNEMKDYPAQNFVDFFENHGLLSPKNLNPFSVENDRLQWYTIAGGSKEYVNHLTKPFIDRILLQSELDFIEKNDGQWIVYDTNGRKRMYDSLVFACHPDQALQVLRKGDFGQKKYLEKISYSSHEVVLHNSEQFMLTATEKWPSWTYGEPEYGRAVLTYNMNRLQHIDQRCLFFVTLDPHVEIEKGNVLYRTQYQHPIFTAEAVDARDRLKMNMGENELYFCGAWMGHGFHEDGLRSAIEVAKNFDVDLSLFQEYI